MNTLATKKDTRPRGVRMAALSENLLAKLVLLVFVLVTIFPALWMFLTSIKTHLQAFTVPPVWIFAPTLQAYFNVFQREPFARFFANSLVIAFATTALSLTAGALAAYSLSVFRFRGANVIGFAILAIRMMPPVSTVVPMYLTMKQLNLIDTHLALILVYTAFNVSFATWLLKGFIDALPKDLVDCGLVDGCTHLQAFLRIIMPLMAPGLAATAVFTYILSWNDFMFAMVLTTTQAKTLPVVASGYITEEGVLWNNVGAAGTLILLPVIVFSLLVQKHLVRGMTAGAVKG